MQFKVIAFAAALLASTVMAVPNAAADPTPQGNGADCLSVIGGSPFCFILCVNNCFGGGSCVQNKCKCTGKSSEPRCRVPIQEN